MTEEFEKFTPTTTIQLREGSGRDNYMFHVTLHENKKPGLFSKIKLQWNLLPLELRKCDNLELFKKKLKSHYFI